MQPNKRQGGIARQFHHRPISYQQDNLALLGAVTTSPFFSQYGTNPCSLSVRLRISFCALISIFLALRFLHARKPTTPAEMRIAAAIPQPMLTLAVLDMAAASTWSMPMVVDRETPCLLAQQEDMVLLHVVSAPQHQVPSVH
jgi:hypothetical protein